MPLNSISFAKLVKDNAYKQAEQRFVPRDVGSARVGPAAGILTRFQAAVGIGKRDEVSLPCPPGLVLMIVAGCRI